MIDLCSHELQEGMLNFTEDYFEPNEGDDCVHCTSQFSDKLSLEQMLVRKILLLILNKIQNCIFCLFQI